MTVQVVGAGLAGCEAAWQLAKAGVPVTLYEMKPVCFSPAHRQAGFAELVCSNSFKALRLGSAAGMLKQEMRLFGSLVLSCADRCSVGAGGALAVDREQFSALVTQAIEAEPLITVVRKELETIPDGEVIVATGPLTSQALANSIFRLVGGRRLSFYDAAAPIVTAESIDLSQAFFAARYDRGEADYINCGMDRPQYERFYQALVEAETAPLHDFDQRPSVYEGCMPVEVMAKRGPDTLRYGPLRPIGLRHPQTGQRYYAVLQLRKENRQGSMYNLVGFQTNLKFSEQKRVFSLIPGLEQAEFVRYGVMHRNTFLDSPRLLNEQFCLRAEPRIRFAGQITGVEGYMESAASGIIAGWSLARQLQHRPDVLLPRCSMIGALCGYISDPTVEHFQPMGANMGLLPPWEERIRSKQLRYEKLAQRGIDALQQTLTQSV